MQRVIQFHALHMPMELDECMKYLTFVVNYCKNELKAEKLFIYSVSFGGYLTLKYMAEIGNPFTRVALRCPGIHVQTHAEQFR